MENRIKKQLDESTEHTIIGDIHIQVESEPKSMLIKALLKMCLGGASIGAYKLKRIPDLLDNTKKVVVDIISKLPEDFLE